MNDCPLTARQLDILAWASEGLSVDRIAAQLDLTAEVVLYQLRTTYREVGASNRTQAVATAIRKGWIP